MKGCEEFGEKVHYYLKHWRRTEDSLLVPIECPRFATGEGKGIILESIRGKDIFIITDFFNYNVTYKMHGQIVPMSPDEHYQDLKRIITAIAGRATRVSLIMPMLYEGRQHRRTYRESLDCAVSLIELVNMGVSNIVTFDAHDPRVDNAIPLCSFDNFQPTYQMIKAMVRTYPDIQFNAKDTVIISPDEGGVSRCISYTSILNLELGMFYKRRNLLQVVDGGNPIESHEYIGGDVSGRDVIVIDDMISSGGSLIETLRDLKMRGAKRIFAFITFGLFCKGSAEFDAAFAEGVFDKIFVTNLVYMPEELLAMEWLASVDLSKYTAYVIDSINHEKSVGAIIDPNKKVKALLAKKRSE
jgi:ribose-phosphate pyrophosphokinase